MATKHTHIIEARSKGFKKAGKESKKLKGSLLSLKNSVMGLGAAYLGASGLIAGIQGSISAYSEQERVEKKLKGALGSSTDALLKQASALQSVTIFGDEAIIAQQAFLASIGMTEQQIRDILPVAADLSAATGITLESAVRNTAKTFSGLAGELGELVPQLRGLTAEEMKAGEAVKIMAELFKNEASVEARTLSGRLTRVKNVMGDIAEDIGESLAPALDDLAFAFLNAMGQVDETEALEKAIEVQKRLKEGYEEANGTVFKQSILHSEGKTITLDYTNAIEETSKKIKDLEEELARVRERNHENLKQQKQEELDINAVENAQTEANINKKIREVDLTKELTRVQQEQKESVFDPSRVTDFWKAYTEAMEDNIQVGFSAAAGHKTIAAAVVDSAKAETRALLQTAIANIIKDNAKFFGFLGPAAPFAIAAVSSGAATAFEQQLSKINIGSQTGFEGVVDEPTQFTVGEGGAAEYVSVTPMEGVNNAGGGQGININISGNVMSQQFVEEELSERIAEAVRKGISFA